MLFTEGFINTENQRALVIGQWHSYIQGINDQLALLRTEVKRKQDALNYAQQLENLVLSINNGRNTLTGKNLKSLEVALERHNQAKSRRS